MLVKLLHLPPYLDLRVNNFRCCIPSTFKMVFVFLFSSLKWIRRWKKWRVNSKKWLKFLLVILLEATSYWIPNFFFSHNFTIWMNLVLFCRRRKRKQGKWLNWRKQEITNSSCMSRGNSPFVVLTVILVSRVFLSLRGEKFVEQNFSSAKIFVVEKYSSLAKISSRFPGELSI